MPNRLHLNPPRKELEVPVASIPVAWKQGVKAYCSRLDVDSNPYPLGVNSSRQLWFDGWYDTRRILKWGTVVGDAKEKFRFIYKCVRNETC